MTIWKQYLVKSLLAQRKDQHVPKRSTNYQTNDLIAYDPPEPAPAAALELFSPVLELAAVLLLPLLPSPEDPEPAAAPAEVSSAFVDDELDPDVEEP